MSLNMITPSGRKARHGCGAAETMVRALCRTCRHTARACNDSSIAMSGVSERWRNGYLSEYLRTSQHAARLACLRASALSKRRHVPPRLPHKPYGRPLSRCEARRQIAALPRGTACKGAPSPRATRSRSGSAAACAACGAQTLRRARVRGCRASSGASGASRTRASAGRRNRPSAAVDGARQARAVSRRTCRRAIKRQGARAPASFVQFVGRTMRSGAIFARQTGVWTHLDSLRLSRNRAWRTARAARCFRCRATLRLQAAPSRKALRSPRGCEALRTKQRVARHTKRPARCAAPLSRGSLAAPGTRCAAETGPHRTAQTAAVRASGRACVRPRAASAACVAWAAPHASNCAFRVAALLPLVRCSVLPRAAALRSRRRVQQNKRHRAWMPRWIRRVTAR